jgi:uncharacterized damage-inducible protein DinB
MQPLATIRGWQLDKLGKDITIIGYMLESASAEDLRTYRDGGDGWTVLEVLGHLRDYEELFIKRAQLTLTEESPALPNPNPDELAVTNQYNHQNAQAVFDKWAESRREFIKLLEGVADDDWERAGNHPRRGHFTLNDQLLLTAWHDVNHIEQIAHILVEKKQ